MPYYEVTGNIFNTHCDAVGDTNNCVGVAGAGIALEHHVRYPIVFEEYKADCKNGLLNPGGVYYYNMGGKTHVKFTIKDHWRDPSKIEWVESCLRELKRTFRDHGLNSIALTLMGTANGGLDKKEVLKCMRTRLKGMKDLTVVVYHFDKHVSCPEFRYMEQLIRTPGILELLPKESGINGPFWMKMHDGIVERRNIFSMFPYVYSEAFGDRFKKRELMKSLFMFLRERAFSDKLKPVRRIVVIEHPRAKLERVRDVLDAVVEPVDGNSYLLIVSEFSKAAYGWAKRKAFAHEKYVGSSSLYGDELFVFTDNNSTTPGIDRCIESAENRQIEVNIY
ncbi:MAG: hypothetical protein GY861_20970 [bacterium]|nr:hypothetical protein [bacterium]